MGSILFKFVRNCNFHFKCNNLKNGKVFLNFLLHFWNLHQILNILNKRMIVIANVFPKLQTLKILLRRLSKKSLFRTGISQHLKMSQINAKSPSERFFIMFLIILREVDSENVSASIRLSLSGVC